MPPLYRRIESDHSLTPILFGVVTAEGLDTGAGATWGQPVRLRLHEASVRARVAEDAPVVLRLHEAAVVGFAVESTPPAPAEGFAVPEFLIGVDSQPVDSFAKWQGRGVNTVVRRPSGHDDDEWTLAAQTAGLYMIRRPRAGTADDGDVPGLIAWALRDEPDLRGDSSALTVSQGNELRARNPNRPVFLNYAGGVVLGSQGDVPPDYYQTTEAAGDWICNDYYPVTGWNRPDRLNRVGVAVDILRDISPSKPQFAYIECSDQNQPNLAHRAATPDEMRAQIWWAIIAGVKGIIYFPMRLGFEGMPFSFDGVTDAGLEAEMIAQNTILSDLGPILLAERNPAGYSALGDEDIVNIGWRSHGSSRYIIVLNKTATMQGSVTIALSGFDPSATQATVYGEDRTVAISGGSIVDTFEPYEKHIYIIN